MGKISSLTKVGCSLALSGIVAGCAGIGELVGSDSAINRTSIVPASVPYYLDLCGPDSDKTYKLYAPSSLGPWYKADDQTDPDKKKAALAEREKCVKSKGIDNGDPITVRLHRVGIGGLAKFDETGKCTKWCKRDIAIVLDFNGSQTLQRPIVAFYQTDVAPDTNLQFVNQIIFAQNEWFYRYPPSVRVRLYDVRDDKDATLRANLQTVKKGVNAISSYIAGAAIAGPIIDTAVQAADQLVSGPRNRAIMDMSFQLFPDEQTNAEPPKPDSEAAAKAKAENEAALTSEEVKELQKSLKMPAKERDGKLGTKTLAELTKAKPAIKNLTNGSADFNSAARALITTNTASLSVRPRDATFGSPIYASQFIVFEEGARLGGGCVPPKEDEAVARLAARRRLGEVLPAYYFAPDGVRYGGARVYSKKDERSPKCVTEASFVTFSITKESTNVAADVAKRMSDLQTKFATGTAVSEDAVTSLESARVDTELALAIDRVENMRRADRLRAMIIKLHDLVVEAAVAPAPDKRVPPLPNAALRSRAAKLVNDYIGCTVNDQTAPEELTFLADQLASPGWQNTVRTPLETRVYFAKEVAAYELKCTKTSAVAPAPPEDASAGAPGPVAAPVPPPVAPAPAPPAPAPVAPAGATGAIAPGSKNAEGGGASG